MVLGFFFLIPIPQVSPFQNLYCWYFYYFSLSKTTSTSPLNHSWGAKCCFVPLEVFTMWKLRQEAVDKKENCLWWKRKALAGRTHRWKLICKSLVQVRIQRPPVPQRSTRHHSWDRSLFCNKTDGIVPFQSQSLHYPSLTDSWEIWSNPNLFSFVYVVRTDISQGRLDVNGDYNLEEKRCFLKSVPMNYIDEQSKIMKTEPWKTYILRKDFDTILSL